MGLTHLSGVKPTFQPICLGFNPHVLGLTHLSRFTRMLRVNQPAVLPFCRHVVTGDDRQVFLTTNWIFLTTEQSLDLGKFNIIAKKAYLRNYLSHNNGSPIKMCRISTGKQSESLQYYSRVKSNKKVLTIQEKKLQGLAMFRPPQMEPWIMGNISKKKRKIQKIWHLGQWGHFRTILFQYPSLKKAWRAHMHMSVFLSVTGPKFRLAC